MSMASPLWSRQQREWLQALGHPPLMLVDRQAIVSVGPARPEPQLAAEAPQAATAPVAPDSRPPVPTSQPDDGLQRALLRATGLPAVEAGKLLQSLNVDAAALRGDPAAKRVLWSRLRRARGDRSP